ncbi:MAG: hypothetical protein JO033_23915 [Acidobacteriaceae bacterium]|nr:hypothetical protein [Acidobacteriaceae bacterium]
MLPFDGRPPRPSRHSIPAIFISFDRSPQGALLYSRALTTSDVVLIRDVTTSKESE